MRQHSGWVGSLMMSSSLSSFFLVLKKMRSFLERLKQQHGIILKAKIRKDKTLPINSPFSSEFSG